jgi:nucleotide-binding universal stress UspA family protein
MITLKTILVATDFGESSRAALSYAGDVAKVFSSTLHIVHVVRDLAARDLPIPAGYNPQALQRQSEDDARQQLGASLDSGMKARGVMTAVLVSNSPANAILEYARSHNIDAIVMGTHGRSGFADLFMGAVAQHVVRRAPCPVLTLRAAPMRRIDAA